MSIKYFPFDSTFTGVDADGIPQGDRGATSADWAAYIGRMFTDGYFRLLDDQLTPSISTTPMAVDIASGAAMIKGRQYSQDAPVTVSLGLSSSQPRIDRIVLRMSTEVADRKISLVVIKGTPASSPTAPALTRTASVYDICLSQISVGANAIQIVEDDLTDKRTDDTLCGYVKILLDGRYYPDTTIPALLWVYTMYPDTLTTEQKAVIEGDTELMDIYEMSRLKTNMQDILTKLLQEITVSTSAQQISITPPDYSEYDHLRIVVRGSTNDSTNVKMRINNDSTAGKYDYSGGGFYTPGSQSEISIGYSDGEFYLDFSMGNFIPSKISGLCVNYNNLLNTYASLSLAYSINISELLSVQLYVESGYTINAGTKIYIYGVKT